MTKKDKTYGVLEKFLTNGKIDESFLNKQIIEVFSNTKRLATNEKRSSKGLVWEAFIILTDSLLTDDISVYKLVCSSDQLKSWLSDFGNGYDALKKSVEFVDNHKRELRGE